MVDHRRHGDAPEHGNHRRERNIMTEMPTISSEDMGRLVARSEASPLLPEGVPGPVKHAGQWWAIPADIDKCQTEYRPVTNLDQIAMLDRNAQRYATARAATARIREAGGSS